MDVLKTKNGVSVRAYKGDAMTLLAMDLDKKLTPNFTGFSIKVTPPGKPSFFLFNRLCYSPDVQKKNKIDPKNCNGMDVAPLQKFRWVHVPSTNHNINDPVFGDYVYEVTPRYMKNDMLQPLDPNLSVSLTITVSPYKSGNLQIGFTRGFIESQAFCRHFGMNNATRPNKKDLVFDITAKAGPLPKDKKKDPKLADYTYQDMHEWLGWQARSVVMDFLNEIKSDASNSVDVFAFDLNEPVVCSTLLELAAGDKNRVRIILDNSKTHVSTTALEQVFEKEYKKKAKDPGTLVRGHFQSLAHSKVFILKKNGKPVKVLTGSTNFSTNGLYINANHVLVFNDATVASTYEDIFQKSFSLALMSAFKNSQEAAKDFAFKANGIPDMTIRFSPHPKDVATKFFTTINKRILAAKSDVLFAIMNDKSASSILDAVQKQVKSDKVFTYGITDVIGKKSDIKLYKPDSKKGIRIAGKPGTFILPPPFTGEAKIPGISIHHKFVVVDFKSDSPVVFCGSSNLAFGPEQQNGDNLLEIRDKDAVTAFAIEAIRLVDHFQFRDKMALSGKKASTKTVNLHDSSENNWVDKYYDDKDLMFMERTLFMK